MDTASLSIIPTSDPRFSEGNFEQFQRVSRYLAHFRTIKGQPVPRRRFIRSSKQPTEELRTKDLANIKKRLNVKTQNVVQEAVSGQLPDPSQSPTPKPAS